MKHYIQSDENGGFKVSKSMLVFIGFICMVVGMVVPMVSAYVSITNDIQTLKDNNFKSDVVIAEETLRVNTLEKNNIILNSQLEYMGDDIGEIKADIKEIKKCIDDIKNKGG